MAGSASDRLADDLHLLGLGHRLGPAEHVGLATVSVERFGRAAESYRYAPGIIAGAGGAVASAPASKQQPL
jgi:hypothetical protein